MSRLKQLILTLCVLSSLFVLYHIHPFFTFSLLILSSVVYLYLDYEEHQPPPTRPSNPSFIRNYFNLFLSWAVTYIPNKFKSNRFNTPNNNNYRPNMPSITPYSEYSRRSSAQPNRLPTSSYLVSPNLNENRLRSATNFSRPRTRGTSPSLNSSDAFNALSPIRRNHSSNRSNTSHEFNNLSISGIRSPYLTPNQQLLSHTSYASNSSRDSSFKQPCSGSATRNVQTFAGPLLASTRYNLSSDSALFADVASPGLSSRVAKYGSDSLNSSRSITHQAQYSGPGQFPIVHLGKTSRLPVLSGRNSQKLARAPVRVRMAPPESDERRSYVLSDRSQILSDYSPGSTAAPKSVLDTLHELSRKRLHVQLGDAEEEAVKKQRTKGDDGATQKRGRDETTADDGQMKKRTRSNEILSSLSSSRGLAKNIDRLSNKRKTSADMSNDSLRMPAGKVQKTSSPSPEAGTLSSYHCETAAQTDPTDDETDSQTQVPYFTPQPTPFTQPVDNVNMTEVTPQRSAELHSDWLRHDFMNRDSRLDMLIIRDKRQEDTKSRLKGMMSTIGGRDGNTGLGSRFGLSTAPITSALTSSVPDLNAPKLAQKHVHFADNLTQVKTFETPTSESTSTFGASSTVTSASAVNNSADAVKTAPAVPTTKLQVPVLDGFKMPASVASLAFDAARQPDFGTAKASNVGQGDSVTNFAAAPQDDASKTSKTTSGDVPTAFSFGANASSAAPPLTFGLAATPSLGSAITTATPSSTVLGPITSPAVAKTTAVGSTFGQVEATLGQTAAPVATFGQAAPSTFGQHASTATATFGQTPPVSTFGQNASFGSTTASAMFGNATPTFGSSNTTTSNTSVTTSLPKVAFGSSSTFGGLSTAPAFGSTASSLASTGSTFGPAAPTMATTAVSGFGSTNAQLTTTFGSSASSLSTSGSSFGSLTTTTGSVFGSSTPSLTMTMPQDGGFNATPSKPEAPKLFGFGGVTSPQTNLFAAPTKSSGFGTPSQNPPPPYGAATAATTQGSFAFASNANSSNSNIANSPMFGAKPDQQIAVPTFGSASKSSTFQFNANQNSATDGGGGGFKFDLAQPSKTAQTPSLFGGFNSANVDDKPASSQSTFGFGGAPTKPFGFGETSTKTNNPPTLFGNTNAAASPISSIQSPSANFGQNLFGSQTQQQTGVNASNLTQIPTQQKTSGLFSFGGSAPQQAPVAAAQSGGFAFGNPAKPGGFSFGNSTGQSAPPSFGQMAQPAPPSFGQMAQPAASTFGQMAQPAAPSFGQGMPTASSGGAFQFGSAPTASTGGFNFGSSASNPAGQTPNFGGAQPANNSFQMGGAPQFGAAQQQQQQLQQQHQAGGMFSIGTGSSAPRGRLARSRRPR